MKTRKNLIALDLLENELLKLSPIELESCVGGSGSFGSFQDADCVYQAIAFATGQSVDDVKHGYENMMKGMYGSTGYGELGGFVGIDSYHAGLLAQYMGLTNTGHVPSGSTGSSWNGDQSVAFLNYGNGTGHAIVLTGLASYNTFYYYDPQTGATGTISRTDGRFSGTYGY